MNLKRINSQSLKDTQVEYISQKYTFGKYAFEKYTFEKYALRFHFSPFTFHFSLEIRQCDQLTDRRTWVGARDTCVSKKEIILRVR